MLLIRFSYQIREMTKDRTIIKASAPAMILANIFCLFIFLPPDCHSDRKYSMNIGSLQDVSRNSAANPPMGFKKIQKVSGYRSLYPETKQSFKGFRRSFHSGNFWSHGYGSRTRGR